jgi:hypothetical protein
MYVRGVVEIPMGAVEKVEIWVGGRRRQSPVALGRYEFVAVYRLSVFECPLLCPCRLRSKTIRCTRWRRRSLPPTTGEIYSKPRTSYQAAAGGRSPLLRHSVAAVPACLGMYISCSRGPALICSAARRRTLYTKLRVYKYGPSLGNYGSIPQVRRRRQLQLPASTLHEWDPFHCHGGHRAAARGISDSPPITFTAWPARPRLSLTACRHHACRPGRTASCPTP